MVINVIGLGYIGLPTALSFAAAGANVVGTDYNINLVAELNKGKRTFKENGIEELFDKARENNIRFTNEYIEADVYIIAVPTPYVKASKKIDVEYVMKAVDAVLDICKKGAILVLESTVSPGTIDKYIRPEIEKRGVTCGEDIHVVHAPERIIPGKMIYELKHNPRTIGADDPIVGNKIRELYSLFCEGEIIVTDIRTAEMTKVVENTYRDINIAFANELTKICASDNMDVYKIIEIANKHPRVNILSPGPGVGGHCISVDPWFLVGDYPGLANIILTARKINDSMPEYVLERINSVMEKNNMLDVSRVGLYGLTYKEDVDDVRESPTLQLLDCMRKHLARGIKVYDPYVDADIVDNQYHDFDKFISDCEIIVIMVGHKQIIDNESVLMDKIVLDTRNIIKSKEVYKL